MFLRRTVKKQLEQRNPETADGGFLTLYLDGSGFHWSALGVVAYLEQSI